jgi:hypothetical protein
MADTAVRWSGLFLLVGAVLLGTGITLATIAATGPLPSFVDVLLFLSAILLLLSLPAMYAQQAKRAGWPGLVGYGLLQTGTLLIVVATSPSLRNPSYNPPPAEESAVDGLLAVAFVLGLLLTAIATIRAGFFPRGADMLLLIGMVGFFFAFFVAGSLPGVVTLVSGGLLGIVLLLAFAWIGLAMFKQGLAENMDEPARPIPLGARQS